MSGLEIPGTAISYLYIEPCAVRVDGGSLIPVVRMTSPSVALLTPDEARAGAAKLIWAADQAEGAVKAHSEQPNTADVLTAAIGGRA